MKTITALLLTFLVAVLPLPAADAPLSLFEIQTQTGQVWLSIKAHLDAKDAQLAAVTAERDALKAKLDAMRAAWAAKDMAKIQAAADEAAKTDKQKAIEAAKAAFAAAKKALEDAQR